MFVRDGQVERGPSSSGDWEQAADSLAPALRSPGTLELGMNAGVSGKYVEPCGK